MSNCQCTVRENFINLDMEIVIGWDLVKRIPTISLFSFFLSTVPEMHNERTILSFLCPPLFLILDNGCRTSIHTLHTYALVSVCVCVCVFHCDMTVCMAFNFIFYFRFCWDFFYCNQYFHQIQYAPNSIIEKFIIYSRVVHRELTELLKLCLYENFKLVNSFSQF